MLQQTVLTSFKLMLDFYGMRMVDRAEPSPQNSFLGGHNDGNTDEIWLMSGGTAVNAYQGFARTASYRERYRNFERRPHNWLRMTRIIKCLGLCGLAEFQAPFCRFLLNEVPPHLLPIHYKPLFLQYHPPMIKGQGNAATKVHAQLVRLLDRRSARCQ